MRDSVLLPLNSKKGNERFTLVDQDVPALLGSKKIFAMNFGRYAALTIRDAGKKRTLALHKYILGIPVGSRVFVDHINGDTLDNRRVNLRTATSSQNCINRKRECFNRSGFKGVSQCGKSFLARLRQSRIGYFPTAQAAALAYDEAARKEYGKFATLNFPSEHELGCNR